MIVAAPTDVRVGVIELDMICKRFLQRNERRDTIFIKDTLIVIISVGEKVSKIVSLLRARVFLLAHALRFK
jgi:hypothetical protein